MTGQGLEPRAENISAAWGCRVFPLLATILTLLRLVIDDGSELSWCPHHNGPDQDLWVFAQELLGKTSGQCRIPTVGQMQIFLTRNLQMKGRTCAGCGTTSSCVLSQSGGCGSAFCWTQDALLHGNKSTHHPCRNKQLTKNHSNWSWLSWLRISLCP